MSIYQQTDYKAVIKARIKDLKASQPHQTLKKLAQNIPLQYTFISKVLNNEDVHLGEDHLFKLSQLLEFLPDETDFLLLLRSSQTTHSSQRREYCIQKIEQIRRSREISADFATSTSEGLKKEMAYLFNPFCMLIHVALFIKDYQQAPQKLSGLLGIPHEKLREALIVLENSGYILTGEDPFDIKEVKQRYPHFGPEHPLTRLHQGTIKNHMLQKLSHSAEENKDSFFVTFTMDEDGFIKVKKLFREFLKQVQDATFDAKHKQLYQLNFDLLKWF
ncbi:MAG: DUF4423 domain-containing protein [Pseudobdellovibrionaceae bacterium]